MFKDTFKLRKSAYHAKMMYYIWRLKPENFSHMCPYWWLSVFNHITFIPIFVVKEGYRLIKMVLRLIFSSIGSFLLFIYDGIANFLSPYIKMYVAWRRDVQKRAEERQKAKERADWEKAQAMAAEWAAYYKEHPDELVKLKKKKNPDVFEDIARKLRNWHWDDWQAICDNMGMVEQKLQNQEWIKEAEKVRQQVAENLKKKKERFLSLYSGDDTEALLSDGTFETYLTKYDERKRQSQIEAEAARQRAIKDRINKILRIVKPIMTGLAYVAGSIVVLVALYYLYIFFSWVGEGISSVHVKVGKPNWGAIGGVFKWIGLGIGAIAILIGIGAGIRYLLIKAADKAFYRKYNSNYIPKKKRKINWEPFRNVIAYIAIPFVAIPFVAIAIFFGFIWKKGILRFFKGVVGFFKLAIRMIKNECPAIEWED